MEYTVTSSLGQRFDFVIIRDQDVTKFSRGYYISTPPNFGIAKNFEIRMVAYSFTNLALDIFVR